MNKIINYSKKGSKNIYNSSEPFPIKSLEDKARNKLDSINSVSNENDLAWNTEREMSHPPTVDINCSKKHDSQAKNRPLYDKKRNSFEKTIEKDSEPKQIKSLHLENIKEVKPVHEESKMKENLYNKTIEKDKFFNEKLEQD